MNRQQHIKERTEQGRYLLLLQMLTFALEQYVKSDHKEKDIYKFACDLGGAFGMKKTHYDEFKGKTIEEIVQIIKQ